MYSQVSHEKSHQYLLMRNSASPEEVLAWKRTENNSAPTKNRTLASIAQTELLLTYLAYLKRMYTALQLPLTGNVTGVNYKRLLKNITEPF
jgi:hypothetical protein